VAASSRRRREEKTMVNVCVIEQRKNREREGEESGNGDVLLVSV
jgi:hypothetical protein